MSSKSNKVRRGDIYIPLVTQAARSLGYRIDFETSNVGRVLLTGGSAYIPAFRDDLVATFGADRLEQRDAFTAVAHGLGGRAQQLRGSVSLPLA